MILTFLDVINYAESKFLMADADFDKLNFTPTSGI